MVRTNLPQWAPLAWSSGASRGIVTVVARISVIFIVPPLRTSFETGSLGQGDAERGEHAAVDLVLPARYEARLRARKEGDHLGHLFRFGHPTQGVHSAPVLHGLLDALLPLEQVRCPPQHRGVHRGWADRVHPDVLLRVV